jgi:hypothetical protein
MTVVDASARVKPTVFSAADDLLHEEYSSFGPHARESLLITAPIPSEELLVFAYLWREGGSRWGRFLFVAGPDMAKPEFVSFVDDAEYTGDDLRDFELSGLRWRQPEPLRTAEIAYSDGDLDLQVQFEAIHAPFSWHDNQEGCAEWVAHERYEQSGRTRVRMNLRGREIDFSGVGHRDHSWGPRNLAYLQHWKWMNAATLDGSASLHCMLMHSQGEIITNGYLNAGGIVSPIATARAHAELDEMMVHRRVTGEFVDELGRTMNLDAHYGAGWSMPIRTYYFNEIGMSATLDGAPAIAHVEAGWPQDYVHGLTSP